MWNQEMGFRMLHNLKRHIATMLHRIRLGVVLTRRYAHMIGCSDVVPNCEHRDVPETPDHIAGTCLAYADERRTLIHRAFGCMTPE